MVTPFPPIHRCCLLRICFIEIPSTTPILNSTGLNGSSKRIAEGVIHTFTFHLARDHEIASVHFCYLKSCYGLVIVNVVDNFFLCNIPGQKFAIMEEKVILSTIFRNFHVRALDKRENIAPLNEVVLRPREGIRLCLTSKKLI